MYAVIETGGKQYKVSVGDVVYVEKLDAEEGDEITFDKVLVCAPDGSAPKVGSPFVKGASVLARLIKQGKSKKITVFTYRPKKDSKRKLGHRQRYSKAEIVAINY